MAERIDKLVGDHAARLSAQLKAHRDQLNEPSSGRALRRFSSGEAADLLGVQDAYLRKSLDDPDLKIRKYRSRFG